MQRLKELLAKIDSGEEEITAWIWFNDGRLGTLNKFDGDTGEIIESVDIDMIKDSSELIEFLMNRIGFQS